MKEDSVLVPKNENALRFPDDLRGCHQLISKTRKVLEKTTPHHNGSILRAWQKGILNISVTRESLPRALRLMQALITAAGARGWKIKPSTEKKCCAIEIRGDELGITLRERTKRFEISQEKGGTGYSWKQYRYEPTGLLTLEITDYVAQATRSEWHEGKRQTLEDMLPEFVDGLAAAAEARIAWHRGHEEQQRQWQDDERRRQDIENRKQIELERRNRLLKQAENYEEAADLRELIADFRSSEDLPEFWTDEARSRWASWADRIADKLDPFRNGYFSEKLAQTGFEPQLDCRSRFV